MPLVRHRSKRHESVTDAPGHRDYLHGAPLGILATLPAKVGLRPRYLKTIYHQGQLGSCTGNAIAAAIQFDRMKQKRKPDFIPSRLFIYYNERDMEGTIESDSGAQIRDGIKSVAKLGDCPETEWPYDIAQFATKPPAKCYKDARKYKAVLYKRVSQTPNQMKGCLASGYPFVFGFSVYESFEGPQVGKTGVVPMPKKKAATRRPCRTRRRLRRQTAALHRAQFMGTELGQARLLPDAVCVSDERQPGG